MSVARATLIDAMQLLDPFVREGFAPLLAGVLADAAAGDEVRIAALRALPLLGGDHAPIGFRTLAANLAEGRDVAVSARAIMQIKRESWDAAAAGPAAEAVLRWARATPEGERQGADYIDFVQTATELAALMPGEDSTRVRKELLGLAPRVFSIRSVREQMRYDLTNLVVEAGKPFTINFENVDMMPHNIVIVPPGEREAVGLIADKMLPVPDKEGRQFVPNDKRILGATRLVEAGTKATLRMKAPEQIGNYDMFCSYPEHWKTMYGQVIVVRDMDAYLRLSARLRPAPKPAQAAAPVEPHKH